MELNMIKTKNFTDIKNQIANTNAKSLVIFDVDDVLIRPYDQIFNVHHRELMNQFAADLFNTLPEDEALCLLTIINLQHKFGPVDKSFIDLIRHLQYQNIKVLALTNSTIGKLGMIDSMEDLRINELVCTGYVFERSWQTLPEKFLNVFKRDKYAELANRNPVALFKKGVVFVEGAPKGDALNAFLEYSRFIPNEIIFIDDNLEYLESVAELASLLNIPFIGIEYTVIKESKKEALNKERAEFQFHILKKERKWLSDAEADVEIRKRKRQT